MPVFQDGTYYLLQQYNVKNKHILNILMHDITHEREEA